MSLVLNEYDWAEQMLNNHELGRKPVETLSRVAKYYRENQYSKRDIRKLLEKFLVQCDSQALLCGWSDILDSVVKNVDKFPIIRLDGVDVTKGELERIEVLRGKQLRRLAFTLLCVAKYWNAVSDSNNGWVNTPDIEIMEMADIRTSIQRQSMMFNELQKAGLISFAKRVDGLNVQVLFIEQGEVAIHIRDFRNLGYQYLKYYGGPYFECVNCGITEKCRDASKGRHQKYCPSCAVEIHTRQKVESAMRGKLSKIDSAG